jgi:HlyD family secretion protein
MKRFRWFLLIVAVLAAAGFVIYRVRAAATPSSAANLQTAAVQRGTLTASISSAGTVNPHQSAVIAWQVSGKVGTVSVHQGDTVQAGQVLAALDPGQYPPVIINAEQTLIDAKKTLEGLQDSSLATAQAQQALAQAQKALSDAQATRAGLNAPQVGTAAAIAQAHANYLLQQNTVANAQRAYDHKAHLPSDSLKKAQALSTLSAAQQKLAQDLANYNSLSSPATPQNIALADAAVAVAQAQLQDAQTQWEKVKNGPSAEDVAAAQAAVDAAQATVNEAQLTAPFSGTVTEVSVLPGDLVSPNTEAFHIDDFSSVYVDVQVDEVDMNHVQVGQQAILTFDAIPNQQYTGKVTQIGVDGVSTQGVVNYPVTVQITNPDAAIKPGMTAAVSIVVAQKDNVLLVPNQAIRVAGGQRSVVVLYEGQQIPVPVTIGLTNDTMSEVTGGQLKEGDTVVINPPAATTSQPRGGFGGGFLRGAP